MRYRVILLCLAVGFGIGCIQSDYVLNVNRDGSGSFTDEIVLSAQAVAMLNMNPEGKTEFPPKDEAQLKELLGGDVTLTASKFEDRPDGSRYISIAAVFKDIHKYYESRYAKDHKVIIDRNAAGNITVSLPADHKSVTGPAGGSMPGDPLADQMASQMLQMMRGMKVSVTVNLPGSVIATTGEKVGSNGVRWLIDLTNDSGIEKYKKEMNNDQTAEFKTSLDFPLPLKPMAVEPEGLLTSAPRKTITAPLSTIDKAEVKVRNIQYSRTITIFTETAESYHSAPQPDLGLTLRVYYPAGNEPYGYIPPEITKAVTSDGLDICPPVPGSDIQTLEYAEKYENGFVVQVYCENESNDMKEIREFTGSITLVYAELKEIAAGKLGDLMGKDATDPRLKNLGFTVLSVAEQSIEIKFDGPMSLLKNLYVDLPDGTRLENQGYSGWDNKYEINFPAAIPSGAKLSVNLLDVTSQVKLPFTFTNIKL